MEEFVNNLDAKLWKYWDILNDYVYVGFIEHIDFYWIYMIFGVWFILMWGFFTKKSIDRLKFDFTDGLWSLGIFVWLIIFIAWFWLTLISVWNLLWLI